MDELMIKIDNVSKRYRLGQIGGTTLREELQRFGAKIRGREDPTRKIGAREIVKGETFLALDGVSFEVKKGERVGIIGRNGAGKSTLLKLISRVTAPTSGRIGLNGRVACMLEVGTGFHRELTGRENIYMNGAILGMTKKEIDSKIEQIIDFSEVRQFIDTPVKRYSSGMYVKLAFSVAAHLDSEIMIMDEVLAVGDVAFQKKCLDKMNDISQTEGRTILYVSHNMSTIRQLCDRVIVLDHGRVVFDGDVEEGIDVYVSSGSHELLPTHYSYTDTARYGSFGVEISADSFCFPDKETAEFTVGDRICFQIELKAHVTRDDVCCILRIKDRQNIEKIAACLSEPFSVKEEERATLRFYLDSEFLAPEMYSLSFEIIQFSYQRTHHTYDNPGAMIPIVLHDVDNAPIWSTKYWGNVKLPTLETVRIETE